MSYPRVTSLLLLLAMLLPLPALGGEKDGNDGLPQKGDEGAVTNPVWPRNWPDPTVWLGEDGRYHCIATSPARSIVSDDLFHWKMSDVPPIDKESWETIRTIANHFWAPDVAMVGSKRNMYLTLYNSAEDSKIGVFQETTPGQFHYVGVITSSKETGIHDTIDPEVVTDPKTGKVWLFFGSVGGIHRIELTEDGLALKEGAKYEHVAGLKIEQNHSRSKVFEGSYLHKQGDYWYLFVSSGNYGDHTYQLKVGRAKELTDVFLDREGNRMDKGFATTVLRSDEGDHFYGPGHCGEIFTAKDGREYIFYHCHVQGSRRPGSRPLFISQIQWDKEGWPSLEGGKPSLSPTLPQRGGEK